MKRLKSLIPYRFEIILVALAIIGLFLLLGDNSHNAARRFVDRIVEGARTYFGRIWDSLGLHTRNLTAVDVVAIGLLLIVLGLVCLRVRWRVENAPRFNVYVCPRCGSKLHRAHRKRSDRIFSTLLILALRRYKCVKRECGWSGLVTAKSRQVELESFAE